MADVVTFISQVSLPAGLYDIATGKELIIKSGSGDTNPTKWNGSNEVTITIPTVADLLQNPIQFVGTVGSSGTVSYISGVTGPATGHLVFITAPCTFAGEPCEAGDMAIYDGDKWIIVTGENQVKIVEDSTDATSTKSFKLGTTATSVINVEGKNLALSIPELSVPKTTVNVSGAAIVPDLYVTLEKGSATLVTPKSVNIPTAISNTALKVEAKPLLSTKYIDINQGSFPTLKQVTDNKPVTVTLPSTTINYVSSVDSAIKDVSFYSGTTSLSQITLPVISTKTGNSFYNSIAAGNAADKDFTVNEAVQTSVAVATGFKDGDASNGVLSSVTFKSGSTDVAALVSGIDGSTTVVTEVTTKDNDPIVAGLNTAISTSYDVATEVTFSSNGAVKDTKAEALASATVSNHVLVFTSGDYVASTTYTAPKLSVKGKTFKTTELNVTSKNVLKADIGRAYKTLNTSQVAITNESKYFKFGKASDTVISSFSTTAISLVKTASSITPGSQKVVTGFTEAYLPGNSGFASNTYGNAGTLPTMKFTTDSTVSLSGNLNSNTLASTTEYVFPSSSAISGNVYTLTSASEAPANVPAGNSTVTVGSNGEISVSGKTATVVTDVNYKA